MKIRDMQFQSVWISFILVLKALLSEGKTSFVTFGSVVKLFNRDDSVRLHSHEVKYGSGSGQQSVTGVEDSDDHNSYWAIRSVNDTDFDRGQPIKCGDAIRLYHVSTDCFLHSHLFDSPLSHNQEVSCFGKNGQGDTGDFWLVGCRKNAGPGETWARTTEVELRHKDTDTYLATSGKSYSRPIHGQLEVCAVDKPNHSKAVWVVKEGVYVQPKSSSSHDAGTGAEKDEL